MVTKNWNDENIQWQKHLSEEKAHNAIKNEFLKRLSNIATEFQEVELVKAIIKDRETINLRFIILQ